MAETIEITSGSDATLRFDCTDSEGTALVVSNPTIILADRPIGDRATATLVDGVVGAVSVFIEGSDPIPLGRYAMRVQVTLTDETTMAWVVIINVT